MKILFVGSVCPKSLSRQLICDGVYSEYASDTFQRALLAGFESNNCKADIITAPPMMSFPRYRKIIQRGFSFSKGDGENISGESVGFINIPLIKLLCKFWNLSRLVRCKVDSDTPIIIYEVTSFQLLSAVIFGQKSKKYLVVPDLPEFMSDNKNVLYRLLKKIDRLVIDAALKYIDGFVLLSHAMADAIKVDARPYVLVEGIYDATSNINNPSICNSKEKIVMYTGKIEERFGLRDLLEAFTRIKGTEYRLWLCGNGDIDMIDEYCIKDPRVVYHGSLPHDRILKMQREVSLLVNPRHSNEEFTKYSFPSKTMEYMASGTPTLMCKLQSLPEEYYPYLFFFEDETVDGMSRRLKELLDKPNEEMRRYGQAASAFIMKSKNAKVQTQKILDMVFNDKK